MVAFFKSYFTTKSEHIVATSDHFSEAHLTYIDAALGWPLYSKKGMTDIFELYMPKWPATGLSCRTRISGDFHSALIAFTDTPELFGGEIRILAAVDFKDGKVVRWIDYWDGRSFGAETAAKMRTPPDKFPTNFDYDVASEGASSKIKETSQKLASAFASGDAAAAVALFTNDAVCGCASLVNRRSGSTSRAYWQRHHTARDQSSCTSLVAIRAAASSGRTTEAR